MESGFNMEELTKLLTDCETKYDWVDGKKETLLSYFSTSNEIINELSDVNLLLKHKSRLYNSLIVELFELNIQIYYNNGEEDIALKLTERDILVMDSTNKLYFSFVIKSAQEDIDSIALYELNNFITQLIDKFNYQSKVQSKELIEVTTNDNLLSDHLIIDFLLKIKLNSIEKQFDKLLMPLLISNEWLIEDKIVLIKKLINNLQKGLLIDRQVQALDNLLLGGYRFKISKATSDKYLKKLINIYNYKLEGLGATSVLTKISKNGSVEDNRIDTGLASDVIRNYFMRLNNKNKKLKTILSKEDIEIFISANFKGFSPNKKKLLNPDAGVESIRYLIYSFYNDMDSLKYDSKQKKYCKLLIDNFEKFKNKNIEVLTKKISSPKPKYYPFD
jgi:hypothetical protein